MIIPGPNDSNFQRISDWLPLILIVGGYALAYMGIDVHQWVMNIGFISYGALGLIDSIKRKYHLQFSLKFLRIVGLIVILFLALKNFIAEPGNYFALLALILTDRMVLSPARLESRT